jgi:alpha-beta hydrolase superfamily lysophospholipase
MVAQFLPSNWRVQTQWESRSRRNDASFKKATAIAGRLVTLLLVHSSILALGGRSIQLSRICFLYSGRAVVSGHCSKQCNVLDFGAKQSSRAMT